LSNTHNTETNNLLLSIKQSSVPRDIEHDDCGMLPVSATSIKWYSESKSPDEPRGTVI